MILANTLDIESKYYQNQNEFSVLVCKKCSLLQWYDHYIRSGKKKPKREYDISKRGLPKLEKFKCQSCQSHISTIEIVAPLEKSMGFRLIVSDWRTELEWTGEILFRICTRCGLAEIYEICLSPPMVHNIDVQKRTHVAKTFICPVCKCKRVSQTGNISFSEKLRNQPKYRCQEKEAWYLFGACKECKYMMVFDEF